MATRIRLQRHGKKRYPYYHIVVADSRVKRDGKIIERLGEYNPNTNPATINVEFDRALYWLQTGAQPSDTCRAILSFTGVLHKNHLLNGVKKGAFDEAEAEKKFQAWAEEKEAKLLSASDAAAVKTAAEAKAILDAEKEISDKRAAEILAKTSPMAEVAEGETPAAEGEAPTTEASTEEAPASEEVKTEEAPKEEVKAEEPKKEEAPVAEAPKEEKKEEVKAEEPKKEEKKEEAKADDLTKVEGIGPKIAELLNGKGFATFAALGAAKAEDIKTILTEAKGSFASHEPTTWPMQAQMAADGKWDELKKWQDESDGGKPIEAKAEEEE